MPRQATTTDPFNALGEARRRDIVNLLAHGEKSVNDVVAALRMSQPQASKHLRVLRKVDLVSVRDAGRRRLYSLNADRLKPIHDWVRTFERFWDHQLLRIKEHAESKSATEARPKPRRSTTNTTRRRQP
jgi:DNA-binding transcriptional ArsR family regulator